MRRSSDPPPASEPDPRCAHHLLRPQLRGAARPASRRVRRLPKGLAREANGPRAERQPAHRAVASRGHGPGADGAVGRRTAARRDGRLDGRRDGHWRDGHWRDWRDLAWEKVPLSSKPLRRRPVPVARAARAARRSCRLTLSLASGALPSQALAGAAVWRRPAAGLVWSGLVWSLWSGPVWSALCRAQRARVITLCAVNARHCAGIIIMHFMLAARSQCLPSSAWAVHVVCILPTCVNAVKKIALESCCYPFINQ